VLIGWVFGFWLQWLEVMTRKHAKPRSYAWSLRLSNSDRRYEKLTPKAHRGLEWARELARNARARMIAALEHKPMPAKLTIEDLAERDGVKPATVERAIAQARSEAFGSLSDSGIIYRLNAERRQRALRLRTCDELRCPNPLPPKATRRRKFCDEHATSAAKVARHRAAKRARA
jgi:DNA-binding transcriptional ArsR family regulator